MCAMKSKKEPKNELRLFSPAKLNLFFRVLSKRDDGYHEIASLMQAITLGDTLTFEVAAQDELTSNDPSLPCDETNLVQKGLSLFRQQTGVTFPLKIFIEKRIPTQGGFGGGSSNLATTLWALNVLSGYVATLDELKRWAALISSDAPFFFSSGAAYCTGRGEKIENLFPLPKVRLWLAKPNVRMSTPTVYRYCVPHACSTENPLQLLKKCAYVNDLEAPAFSLCPDLKVLKEDLLSLGFKTAVMTGSGSSFFCLGNLKAPSLPGIRFIPAAFLTRGENNWYNTHECGKISPNEYRTL